VNLINEFHVALMPPRRRVWFLLGGVMSSSILRGYSETESLLKEVVDDGLDDDDPFFFGEKDCRFLLALSLTNIYFGVWTLSGIRMCFVSRNKRGGWLSLRWFRTTN
jgi:hypothetical protein